MSFITINNVFIASHSYSCNYVYNYIWTYLISIINVK